VKSEKRKVKNVGKSNKKELEILRGCFFLEKRLYLLLNLKQTLSNLLKEDGMIQDTYVYYPSKDRLFFIFSSEGVQGSISKIIYFTRMEKKNEWNLAFGDLKDGDMDDSVISNNQDALKIMRTVANTVIEFFITYPESILHIKPVDEKRRKLYNYLFQKNFEEIDKLFIIRGKIGERSSSYLPIKFYDSFKITLKSK
jgi:hypothetical protein